MAKHYKAIILVLASEGPLYNEFKSLYEKYLDCSPDIKAFFTYAGKVSFSPKEHDLVYPDLQENILQPWPTKKVVRALEYIDANYSYDYIVRTNLSTFWVFNRLIARLNTLPKHNVISGRVGYIPPEFVVGTDMVISRNLIQALIHNQHQAFKDYKGKYIAEDRILSEFFTEFCGVPLIPDNKSVRNVERLTEYSQIYVQKCISRDPAYIDHYRVKNVADRQIDINVIKDLISYYYGINA